MYNADTLRVKIMTRFLLSYYTDSKNFTNLQKYGIIILTYAASMNL